MSALRIAVVGAGISGLASAWLLSRRHQVTLFEAGDYLGGNTHTVDVDLAGTRFPVDTGFVVFNHRTYPRFARLLAALGVRGRPSDMSFGVSCRQTGLEYSSRGLDGFFAQRSNILRPAQYHLLREILRFNREAPKLLEDPSAATLTLGDVIERPTSGPCSTTWPPACSSTAGSSRPPPRPRRFAPSPRS